MASSNMAYDRVSKLPDELLISILSSTLTIKEAAATSILSKRWKTLWTYFYGFLDFDDDFKLRLHKTYLESKYNLLEKCTSKYIDYVNKVLNSHQGIGVPITKLRMCWRLRNKSKTVIDSWIDFVMKNKVQHFELDLCWEAWKGYEFPHGIGFPNLTVLRLSYVDLTDESLAYLISSDKCPSLQHISVICPESLKHVKVVGNLKLKSLEFAECWMIEDVEIYSAVNMVSFRLSGPDNTKITFKDVPRLTELSFGDNYCETLMMQPQSFLSQLETLKFDVSCSEDLQRMSQKIPKFDRVKSLEVLADTPPRVEYLNVFVMAAIYGCPRLQKFSLKVIYTGDDNEYIYEYEYADDLLKRFVHEKDQYQHRHECLQAVEYIGWNGKADDLELITDIVKNTMLLDKVTIDPRTTFSSNYNELEVIFRQHKFHIHDKKREEAARNAAKNLKTILPQGVTLIIL